MVYSVFLLSLESPKQFLEPGCMENYCFSGEAIKKRQQRPLSVSYYGVFVLLCTLRLYSPLRRRGTNFELHSWGPLSALYPGSYLDFISAWERPSYYNHYYDYYYYYYYCAFTDDITQSLQHQYYWHQQAEQKAKHSSRWMNFLNSLS